MTQAQKTLSAVALTCEGCGTFVSLFGTATEAYTAWVNTVLGQFPGTALPENFEEKADLAEVLYMDRGTAGFNCEIINNIGYEPVNVGVN